MGFIDAETCHALGEQLATSSYGRYVMDVARSFGATGARGGGA
jgi:glucose-1-phosphate thymidylyltransferase